MGQEEGRPHPVHELRIVHPTAVILETLGFNQQALSVERTGGKTGENPNQDGNRSGPSWTSHGNPHGMETFLSQTRTS
jgi:hypothetical protein